MKDAALVTGGAGYIGSHTVRRLLEDDRKVVVADDLSTGHREVITLFSHVYGPDRFAFEAVNLLDREAIRGVFDRHEIVGIVDFAARIAVGDSQKNPREYFENNVLAFRNLISASTSVPLVKSSTAATYGNPDAADVPLRESYQERILRSGAFPQSQLMPASVDFGTLLRWFESDVVAERPEFALNDDDIAFLCIATSVYGVTKSLDECLMHKLTDRQTVALRYFNAAGADPATTIRRRTARRYATTSPSWNSPTRTFWLMTISCGAASARRSISARGSDSAFGRSSKRRGASPVTRSLSASVRDEAATPRRSSPTRRVSVKDSAGVRRKRSKTSSSRRGTGIG